MRKSILTFFGLFLFASIFAQTGSIDNVQVEQRNDGSELVDVIFNLSGTGDFYSIKMKVSFDEGQIYWPISDNTLSGDTGPISPGSSMHIVWDPTQDFPNRYSPQTKIMIKAYHIVVNSNACPDAPTVTDYDGNVYNTVLIGNQCWMRENLNVSRDATGNYISRFCYNNDPSMCEYYGGLYTWETMMNGDTSSNNNPSGVQGICPDGWHIPSDAEWTELSDYLINTYVDVTSGNIGDKLSSCRRVNSPLGGDCNTNEHPRWNENTSYGTNDFGFSALPDGYKYCNGNYTELGSSAYWWTATEYSFSDAWIWRKDYDSNVDRVFSPKCYGSSVRCIKD